MTIQEAIRSGKRFKHPQYQDTWMIVVNNWIYLDTTKVEQPNLTAHMILSDEWELEPIKKELSREDIEKAFQKVFGPIIQYNAKMGLPNKEEFFIELGL